MSPERGKSERRAFLGRRMTADELVEFTCRETVCRIAMINDRGMHLTATTYVWDGQWVWIPSAVRTQRLVDLRRDQRMTVLVDSEFGPAAGFVEFIGRAEVVGEVPRIGLAHPELDRVEQLAVERLGISLDAIYDGPDALMGGHAWIRLTPTRIVSSAGRTSSRRPPRPRPAPATELPD